MTFEFAEQTCKFEPPNLSQLALSGSCRDFYNKNGDGKIHLSTYTEPTCHIGCRAGYKRIGGTYTCGPNNPNGEKTGNSTGVLASTPLECVGASMLVVW